MGKSVDCSQTYVVHANADGTFSGTGTGYGVLPGTTITMRLTSPASGLTRLCIGGCKRGSVLAPRQLVAGATTLDLTIECGGSAATASDIRASQARESCPTNAKATGEKKELTLSEQLEEAEAKQLAERHRIMGDMMKAIWEVQQQTIEKKKYTQDRETKAFDGYIHANAGSPEVVATLQDADLSLAGMFPPQAGAASASIRSAAARTGPDAAAVLRSMQAARPSAADGKAYTDAVALATSATFSFDRARARLLLVYGVIISRRLLLHELGSKARFTIASAGARVSTGGKRTITLRATGLGSRALRLLEIIGLAHKRTITLQVSSRASSATRSIEVR
jgi:hypothetical protein